jgi:hypothetical protein
MIVSLLLFLLSSFLSLFPKKLCDKTQSIKSSHNIKMSSQRHPLKKGASEYTLIRQTKASLMLIAKQTEAQV